MNKVNVLSYNFFSRSNIIFKDSQKIRSKLLAESIKDYENQNNIKIDVILLQEIFNDFKISCIKIKKKDNIFKRINKDLKKIGFKYHNDRVTEKSCILNGGAYILSRHKIIDSKAEYFEDCNPAIENAMAAKGISYAKILINGVEFNFVNYHLDSFKESSRLKQMKYTAEFFKRNGIINNIIIGGDFNIDYWKSELDNVPKALEGFTLPEFEFDEDSFNEFSYNPEENDYLRRRKGDVDKQKLLDFFIYKSTNFQNINFEVIKLRKKHMANKILFSLENNLDLYDVEKDLEMEDLSDHYPIMLSLEH